MENYKLLLFLSSEFNQRTTINNEMYSLIVL